MVKLWIFGIFILSGVLSGFARSAPEDEYQALCPENRKLLSKAMGLVGDGLSVDPMEIFNNYRPIDLLQALRIQAALLTEKNGYYRRRTGRGVEAKQHLSALTTIT